MSIFRLIGLVQGQVAGPVATPLTAIDLGGVILIAKRYEDLSTLQDEAITAELIAAERAELMALAGHSTPVAFRPDMVIQDERGLGEVGRHLRRAFEDTATDIFACNERVATLRAPEPVTQDSAPSDFLRQKVRQKAERTTAASMLARISDNLEGIVAALGGQTVKIGTPDERTQTIGVLLPQDAEDAAFARMRAAFAESDVAVKLSDRLPLSQFAPPVLINEAQHD